MVHFIPNIWQEACIKRLHLNQVWVGVLTLSVMIYIVAQVKSSEVLPFIYFQF